MSLPDGRFKSNQGIRGPLLSRRFDIPDRRRPAESGKLLQFRHPVDDAKFDIIP